MHIAPFRYLGYSSLDQMGSEALRISFVRFYSEGYLIQVSVKLP